MARQKVGKAYLVIGGAIFVVGLLASAVVLYLAYDCGIDCSMPGAIHILTLARLVRISMLAAIAFIVAGLVVS